MIFEFATATRIIFGNGKLNEVGKIARDMGKHTLVLTGAVYPDPQRLFSLLDAEKIQYTWVRVTGEPSVDFIQETNQLLHAQCCDSVIGFGGGSVVDAAKAVAAMATNPGEVLDYLEVVGKGQALINLALPFMAIPTTAGTGSEVTRNAVLTVTEKNVKVSLRSPLMLPQVALIDPELTYSLPADVTASTGMDALAQVLEPFVSNRANAMTDLFCREGMTRISRSLANAYSNGLDARSREDMAWGSLLGGLALANSGLGAVHGFAAPIGGMFNAPHGAICACLLPLVVNANVLAIRSRVPDSPILHRYQEAAKILTQNNDATIEDGIVWLEKLCHDLKIPRLSHYGMMHSDLQMVAEKAAGASSMKANPIVLTHEELEIILDLAL